MSQETGSTKCELRKNVGGVSDQRCGSGCLLKPTCYLSSEAQQLLLNWAQNVGWLETLPTSHLFASQGTMLPPGQIHSLVWGSSLHPHETSSSVCQS